MKSEGSLLSINVLDEAFLHIVRCGLDLTAAAAARYNAGALVAEASHAPNRDLAGNFRDDAYRFVNAIDSGDANAAYNMLFGAADTFNGSAGADRLRGFSGHDLVSGNGGNDYLAGDSGNDRIHGGLGADIMEGGARSDTIHAGSGYDLLVGGAGRDVLHGGTDAAADAFIYRSWSDSAVGPGHDTIFNFTRATDDIDLRTIDARTAVWGNQAFAFSGQTAAANSVWWKPLDGGGVVVRADVNGNGVADLEIIVKGANWLTADNFLL